MVPSQMLTNGAWHTAGLEKNHWLALFEGPVIFRVQTSGKQGDRKRKRAGGPYPGVFFTNSCADQVTGVTFLL